MKKNNRAGKKTEQRLAAFHNGISKKKLKKGFSEKDRHIMRKIVAGPARCGVETTTASSLKEAITGPLNDCHGREEQEKKEYPGSILTEGGVENPIAKALQSSVETRP